MIVYAPYASPPRPEVGEALAASGRGVVPVDVSGSDSAYFELLSDLWAAGADFAVVEQDVVAPPPALDALAGCPDSWCAFGYPYLGAVHFGLGCARFRAPIMDRWPRAFAEIALWETPLHPARHWCALDGRLGSFLRSKGETCHNHTPPVPHLSDGNPAHGCRTVPAARR